MNHIVTFIMPRTGEIPIGGFKVVYEYANRLVKDGISVNIVYGIASRPISNRFIRLGYYFCRWFRWLKYKLFKEYKPNSWFDTDKRIKHILRYRLNPKAIPETTILVATSWVTAYWVNLYNKISPRNKAYLIQHFEDWHGSTEEVVSTWKMPLHKIVIAPWLKDIAKNMGEEAFLIENGFNQEEFYLTIPIKKKNKYLVTMLWHDNPFKACKVGLQTLMVVKKKIPQLKAHFFGVPERPKDLPEWIYYTQMPSHQEHLQIYNESSIFLGPSSKEGFCLTPPEAMLCGCAVVCTNIGGYTVVAKDNETALLAEVGDYNKLADNIIKLIEDDNLRFKIATAGLEFVKQYTWDNAYAKLKRILFSTLN